MSKENLHLPKTAFSMKANLSQKEPEILKKWEQNKIFEKIRKNSKEKEKFYFVPIFLKSQALSEKDLPS